MYFNKGGSTSLLSHLGYIFSLLLLIGILHQNVALGSPMIQRRDDNPDDPDSDNDDPGSGGGSFLITKKLYPDLDECRKMVSVPKDKSVFYAKVGKHEEKPQDFANQLPDGVLVREAYPDGFADKKDGYDSYKEFIGRASQAFAEASSGVVWVLLPTDGTTDISDRVWIKTEKPALLSNTNVLRIVKVDPDDFTKQCVLEGAGVDNLASCNAENGPIPDPPAPNTQQYAPGTCGLHVTQHQKVNPDDPNSHYKLDITIFDAAGKEIGKEVNQDAPSGQGVGVDSELPFVLIVTAQNVDADAVLFAYADQKWGSNDQAHHCNFGAYDSGARNGDCGFAC